MNTKRSTLLATAGDGRNIGRARTSISSAVRKSIPGRNRHALSIGAALVSGGLMAPMAAAQTQTDEPLDEIVVTGVRGALQNAMQIKRNSVAVVDAVSAEDIGKFPDTNVAEALGRISGVTVSRQFGEGDAVSIRGASNQLTLTTLNGQNIASTGWYTEQAIDRSFNYSMLPPELISSIVVYKSSQADLLEGGIGGTVVVKTRRPLDLDPNTVFLSGSGTFGSVSEDTDAGYSGLYSFKTDSGKFGVMIAAAISEYTLVRRGDEALPSWGGRIAPVSFLQDKERTAVDATLQYAPTENLDFGLHHMALEFEANNVNRAMWVPQDRSLNDPNDPTSGFAHCEANAQGVPVLCDSTFGVGNFNAVTALGQTFYDVRPRNATMDSDTTDAWVRFENDALVFNAQIGTTEATGGTNFETHMFAFTTSPVTGVIDATGEKIEYSFDPSITHEQVAAAGGPVLDANSVISQPNSDKEDYVQADLEFAVEFGPVHALKTGVRYSEHVVERSGRRAVFGALDPAPESLVTSGSVEMGNDRGFTMPEPDGAAMLDYTRSQITAWGDQRSAFADLEEDNTAFYVMAEFEAEGIRGNAGLRYIHTDASSSFFAPDPTFVDPEFAFNNGFSPDLSTEETSYNDVLPSINLAMDMSENVILRLAAAQVIARPNYNDMFSSSSLLGYADEIEGNEQVVTGNVALKPFEASQAEVGVEWYYGDADMLAVSYFVKDVSNFTTSEIVADQQIGIVDPDTGEDSWTIQSRKDGTGGTIEGLELQVQHAFDNGFGSVVNYTFVEADADASNFSDGIGVFDDSSKHSVNLVGYFQNEIFSARAAYSWRSEYMIREVGFYGNREHQDIGLLDLGFVWYATDNLDVTLDVANLLEEESVQVGVDQGATPTFQRTSNGYPAYSYEGEARYKVGLSYRFD